LERLHHRVELALALEANAGRVGRADMAVDHRAVVGKAVERVEHVRVRLVAAEPEPGRDVERHLMPAMRDAAPRRPALPAPNRDAGRRADDLDRRLEPAQVLVERGAADLHLADRVAPVEVAPELVL